MEDNEKKILSSWHKNTDPWDKAIQEGQIASRIGVTNQAIIDTLRALPKDRLLDIGCGEGWLVRAMGELGYEASGVDGSAGLIAKAQSHQAGVYYQQSYQTIQPETIDAPYDIAVCNFSLIGKASVEHIFSIAPSLLARSGYLVIQTLHPYAVMLSEMEAEYSDGWREGSWVGFSDDFVDPPPWYFRTLESWVELFVSHGFQIKKIIEPSDPQTAKPASLILVGSVET